MTPSLDAHRPELFINRELSWLQFNRRVLHEALDERTPLLDQLKFSAIFSNNLDEFFMVRVAALKHQVEASVSKLSPDGLTPQQQLEKLRADLAPTVHIQHQQYQREFRPRLAEHGVLVLDYSDLNRTQQQYLEEYFHARIFPVLTPLAVDPSHPFPYISNLSLNLGVVVLDEESQEPQFARVKVPSLLPRFIELPLESRRSRKPLVWMGVPLEQVIGHHLATLFPGMTILSWHPFRVTRDADIALREDEADDLLLAIEQELRKRRLGGSVVRLEVSEDMPESMREILMDGMRLEPQDVYALPGVLGLNNLMELYGLPLPELREEAWSPVVPRRLRRSQLSDRTAPNEDWEDIFSLIRQRDLLVHHPYESFAASVEQFVAQAAVDPQVLAIKMTLYRTSGDSPIVRSLMQAAENGKQVLALVELKARFDEENNIHWARKLEQSGVHVVYGIVGLKTHTKIVLVVRQERQSLRRYVHFGTGNYNPKTARLYTDLGLLSCQEDLGADLSDLFNYLTGYSKQRSYRSLLVAPVTLRPRMMALIDREIEHAREGREARIIAKMNSLVDPQIIRKLYDASQAGVVIQLVVRGVCCIRPGLPGFSETISVISVIGRYLEHSRIFWFLNGGDEQVFMGSADWMTRNLDRRVEAVVPIEDAQMVEELKEILRIYLADNRQAWDLDSDGNYHQRRPSGENDEFSAQRVLTERAHANSHQV